MAGKLELNTWVRRTAPAGVRSHFRKVAPFWKEAHETYIRQSEGDLGYAYGERVSVGVLAAGVWMSGMSCLEEFRTKKTVASDRDKSVGGRGDLYITDGDTSIIVEAKHNWPRMDSKDVTLPNQIDQYLLSAISDRDCHTEDADYYAVCFLAPYFDEMIKPRRAHASRDTGETYVRSRFEFIERAAKENDLSHAVFSLALTDFEDMKDVSTKKGYKRIWPGCLMIISKQP